MILAVVIQTVMPCQFEKLWKSSFLVVSQTDLYTIENITIRTTTLLVAMVADFVLPRTDQHSAAQLAIRLIQRLCCSKVLISFLKEA